MRDPSFTLRNPRVGVFPNTIPVVNTKYVRKPGNLIMVLEQTNYIRGVMLYYFLM